VNFSKHWHSYLLLCVAMVTQRVKHRSTVWFSLINVMN
jgi:hypothetical protein